jgi:hypothetical protein
VIVIGGRGPVDHCVVAAGFCGRHSGLLPGRKSSRCCSPPPFSRRAGRVWAARFRNTRGSVRDGVYSAMRGGRYCSTRGLATHCLQKTFGAISSQSADTSRYTPLAGGWLGRASPLSAARDASVCGSEPSVSGSRFRGGRSRSLPRCRRPARIALQCVQVNAARRVEAGQGSAPIEGRPAGVPGGDLAEAATPLSQLRFGCSRGVSERAAGVGHRQNGSSDRSQGPFRPCR